MCFAKCISEQLKEGEPILIVLKDDLFAIAAYNDMVKAGNGNLTRRPSQITLLQESCHWCQSPVARPTCKTVPLVTDTNGTARTSG